MYIYSHVLRLGTQTGQLGTGFSMGTGTGLGIGQPGGLGSCLSLSGTGMGVEGGTTRTLGLGGGKISASNLVAMTTHTCS